MISGGYFQDVSINANNVLVMGGHWVDAHQNGKHSFFFRFSTLSSSFLYLSINSSIACATLIIIFALLSTDVYVFRLHFHLDSFRSFQPNSLKLKY
jgi:hypothetical protein